MKKKKFNKKSFMNWALTFTKRVILLVTIVWAVAMFYSAVMISVAIFKIQNFSYLDTYITELNRSFLAIIATQLVSKTVENVFKYNEIGGKSIAPDVTVNDYPSQDDPMDMI